jgi:hypothetical protein
MRRDDIAAEIARLDEIAAAMLRGLADARSATKELDRGYPFAFGWACGAVESAASAISYRAANLRRLLCLPKPGEASK